MVTNDKKVVRLLMVWIKAPIFLFSWVSNYSAYQVSLTLMICLYIKPFLLAFNTSIYKNFCYYYYYLLDHSLDG